MKRTVERTHAWGDKAFAWGARAVALHLARDGKTAWSVHQDGALVMWDVASGDVRSVVARGGKARAAVFLPDAASVIILGDKTMERRDIHDGTLCWTVPCHTHGTLLAGSNEDTVALVPWMFATNYVFSTADGRIVATSGAEWWIAVAGARRVTIVQIPDPNPPPATGWDAAGDPIYEPDHPTYEFRIVDADGRVVVRRPGERLSPYRIPATFSRDGASVFVSDGERLVAYDMADGRESWTKEGSFRVLRTHRFGDGERLLVSLQTATSYQLLALRMTDGFVEWARPCPTADAISDDGAVAVYNSQPIVAVDVVPGKRLHATGLPIRSVAFSPAGDSIVHSNVASEFAVIDIAAETESEPVRIPRAGDAIVAPDDGSIWTASSPVVTWKAGAQPIERPDLSLRDYAPFRFSPSGRFILLREPYKGVMLRERSGELLWQDSSTYGFEDAYFESDDFVVLAGGTRVTRYAIERPPRWIWTAQIPAEGSLGNNLVVALAPGVGLVADRTIGPPPIIRHEFGPPAVGRLRVVAFASGVCEERFELRRWTLSDPRGGPILAVTRDGALGAEAMEGLPRVRIWDLTNGTLVHELDLAAENDLPTCLAFAPAGDALAIGTAGGRTIRYAIRIETA